MCSMILRSYHLNDPSIMQFLWTIVPLSNSCPYRYSTLQKEEIERQVQEMLHSDIISASISHFAPPVLLVKKKDGT
jgi:hypothetical protein